MKLENPDEALRYCNEAVTLDENNVKALYRRAWVYYEKKDWDLASEDLTKALKIAPDNKAILKLHHDVEMAQKMSGGENF
jgi:FK506-binding protein 4/5